MILDIGETDVTVKFQSQTFKVARFCVRKTGKEEDVEDAALDTSHARFRRIGADLGSQPRKVDAKTDMEVDREDGNLSSSAGTPESDSGPRPDMNPVSDFPPLTAQLPSPRAPSDKHQHRNPPLEERAHRLRLQGRTGPSMPR